MSNAPSSGPARQGSIPNGPPSAGMGPGAGASAPPATPAPAQNLNQIVLEYLNKKGYSKTEATLRKESTEQDTNGGPIIRRAEDAGGRMFEKAYSLLLNFVDDSLEVYRPELVRLLWPVFVHCILELAKDYYIHDIPPFFEKHHKRFEREHSDELRELKVLTLPEHLESRIAKIYLGAKYRLSITSMAFNVLLQFLEAKEKDGGSVIITIITQHMHIVTVDRAHSGHERSLAAMLARPGEEYDHPAEDEGIPGHNPGSANTDPNAPNVLAKLALGPMPLDPDSMEDVQAALEKEDAERPPAPGKNTLSQEFEQMIKKEPNDDAPTRDQLSLTQPVARDIAMEIQKVREHRDRFKIDPRSGGIPPGVSVCMYTFHNTFESINCVEYSGDLQYVAVGTKLSYIRIWNLDGSPIAGGNVAINEKGDAQPESSRRLIGHSGPIYAISFSPSTAKPSPDSPPTGSRYLLSSSADRTIRLWSVEGWSQLAVYRGHNSPVWDVRWGPYGHYFLSAGHDKIARLWLTDKTAALRWFVGHDNDVDCACFHPNGAYVFTAGDKSVRMWDVNRGNAVRMFTGHIGAITSMECSPDGKTLASGDEQGHILLWDLPSGSLLKRMRGHGKGGIWSLSWSMESTVLASAGADQTVRIWDATQRQPEKGADGITKVEGIGSSSVNAASTKKSKKDVVVTPDQISVFPTKKSPVYKVHFTRANLVLAASAYLPEAA